MQNLLTTYSVTGQVVTLTGLTIKREQLISVINVTTGSILYASNPYTFGRYFGASAFHVGTDATSDPSTVTLKAVPTAGDNLQIYYEDGLGDNVNLYANDVDNPGSVVILNSNNGRLEVDPGGLAVSVQGIQDSNETELFGSVGIYDYSEDTGQAIVVSQLTADTPTHTTFSSITSAVIVGGSSTRKSLSIVNPPGNASNQILYIIKGTGASPSNFSYYLNPGGTYDAEPADVQLAYYGIFANAPTTAAQVTASS